MKKLWPNTHGAVTIIVSIMLIPAILLSGTAVDLARIHTAKSVAHNANQLAVNSVLAEYNALLKDLYGLFGVAENDPVLAEMVDEYIQVAVFGENPSESWIDTGLGTLQLFNGSTSSADIKAADGYNLGNPDVLRRQIEEYMKFRGPVILVEQLLDALDVHGSSIKASSEAIEQQEVVSEGMLEVFELYRELYNKILIADKCKETLMSAIDPISSRLNEIKTAFGELRSRYANWDSVRGHIKALTEDIEDEQEEDEPDYVRIAIWENRKEMYEKELDEVENRYNAKRKHIVALTNGGSWQEWTVGQSVSEVESGLIVYHADGTTPVLKWSIGGHTTGGNVNSSLQSIINNAKNQLDPFKQNFTNVVTAAQNIDNKRAEIYAELSTLQQKIDAPDCDATLRSELQTQINECKALLDRFPNITGMAENYKTKGIEYIDDTVKEMLDDIRYRDKNDSSKSSLDISELAGIASNNDFALKDTIHADNSQAKRYADYSDVTYDMPPGFLVFRDVDTSANSNRGLYDSLKAMADASVSFTPISIDGLTDNSGSDDPEKQQRSIIEQLVELARNAKDGLISNPQGAHKVVDSTVANGSMGGLNTDAVIDFISDPGDGLQEAANWILMMTYDTSMFSSYTTGKPARLSGEETQPVKSLTNVPMEPEVNYFYQSEWEYLLVGNKNAKTNLDKVKDLIYAIRLVCNTITVFSLPSSHEIKVLAESIRNACLAIPYVGAAVGVILYIATLEAFAAAESAYDLTILRNGCKVPLIKNQNTWKLSINGIVDVLETLEDGDISQTTDEHNAESGVSYEQYMLVFFMLTSDIDTLTQRTGRLIEWNVNNYKSKANANNMNGKFVNTNAAVAALSTEFAAPKSIRLKKMHTDFDITTTIDLRLFFLTMPIFQQQGASFSNTFPVRATDCRGY